MNNDLKTEVEEILKELFEEHEDALISDLLNTLSQVSSESISTGNISQSQGIAIGNNARSIVNNYYFMCHDFFIKKLS